MDLSIFKDPFLALGKLGITFLHKKLERNASVLAVLKGSGLELLQNDFDSIYAHALVEYLFDTNESEKSIQTDREIWFQYFSLPEVRDIVKKHSAKEDEEIRDRLLEDNLITGKTNPHLALKNIDKQPRHLFKEFIKLENYYQKMVNEATQKKPIQLKHIELSKEILVIIKEVQKELLNIQKVGEYKYKIGYAGKSIEQNLAELEEGFQNLKQGNKEILLAIKEISEQKQELVELKQVADKIYNIENVEVGNFKTETINIQTAYIQTPKDPIPRFINPIKVSTKDIIGRDIALKEVIELLQEEQVYIHAIRGVGKTTLGKLVYHTLKEMDIFSYYATVELTENFLTSFVEKLKVPCRIDRIEKETDEELLEKILHALTDIVEKDPSRKNGFILIDNALPRKSQNKQDYLKTVVDHVSNHWKVLVTSYEDIAYLKEYKLDYLTDEKALELFLLHCSDKGSKEEVQLLLNHVGKHTLMVELMAKTLKTSRIKTVTELYEILKNHELGKNRAAQKKVTANHPEGEVIAFEYISKIFDVTELIAENNLVYVLKNYYFLPDYISKEELGDMVKTESLDEYAIDDATEELYKRGWLEKNGSEEEYRLHSIIKEVVYDKLKPGYEDGKALVRSVTEKLKSSEANPIQASRWVSYAKSISNAITEVNEEMADLEIWLGNSLIDSGEYDGSIEYYEKCKQKRIKLHGEKHEAVATTYNNIGGAYRNKGEYDKAIEYYEKAIDIRLEKLGERHPSVATTYNNIGGAYESKGEYDKAIEYYEKAIDIRLEKLGERHPDVATTYNNIGGAYRNKGEYDKAIEYYEKAIDIRLEKLGERHPDVATTYNNIGGAYRNKGEYDKAIEYYEKAIDIRLEKLGERHPDVATTYNNIGGAYESKGEYDKAIEYYEKAIDILKEKLGERHPSVATTYNNIGGAYRNKGEYDKAIEYYEKAIDIRLEKLGERHPDVATTYNNIGGAYESKGEYDKAIEYYEKDLSISIEKLGERHPSVATTYNNIGGAYRNKGEYDKAIEYYEKDLSISIEKLGERHPSVATTYNNIGGAYRNKGEYDKAIEYYEKAIDIRLEKLGERHPSVATTYNNIGGAYRNKGEYDKAIEYYEKAIDIRLEKLGERHPDVATTYNNIGGAYRNKGEYDKAIEYYEKDLSISIEKLGERHPSVATTYNNIGGAYRNKGEYDKAIEYYEKAIDIRLEKLGERHPDVATTYNNIGGAYRNKGEYDKAIEYYEKAIDIRLEKLGERHPDVATTYNNIGGAYRNKGEYDKAIEYYEKAIDIRLEKLGERHPDVATTYNNIGSAYFKKGETELSVSYFQKALDIIQERYGTNHPYYSNFKDGYDGSRLKVAVEKLQEGSDENYKELATEIGQDRVQFLLKLLGINLDEDSTEEVSEPNSPDDIDISTVANLIQEMDEKFQAAGEVDREEFKQFAQLHIVLAIKLLEADRTEEAKQVLARAKQFAEQLGDEELLGMINNFGL